MVLKIKLSVITGTIWCKEKYFLIAILFIMAKTGLFSEPSEDEFKIFDTYAFGDANAWTILKVGG